MKKSIFKRIGLIALAVCVAIGSFFVPVTKKQYNFASAADNSYSFTPVSFTSPNSIIARIPFNNTAPSNNIDVFSSYQYYSADYYNLSFKVDISFDSSLSAYDVQFKLNGYGSGGNKLFDSDYFNIGSTFVNYYGMNIVSGNVLSRPFRGSDNFYYVVGAFLDYASYDSEGSLIPRNKGNDGSQLLSPTGVMKMVEFGTKRDFLIMGYDLSASSGVNVPSINTYYDTDFTFICFTDTANYRYFFILPYGSQSSTAGDTGMLSYRRYLFDNYLGLNDNERYNAGYNAGLLANQSNIYNNGYNAGFDEGRQQGIVSANDYSFIGLISAVVDVPVKTFLGLFSFEFLGVNLTDFFLGLLTFCVIIFVVKLLLGGK